ncbi:MAG TPA: response regulator transcription factor [Terriglobales bacterium]|nr:response regulator transcription factor [Terriglobales bacterium]
MKCRIMITDDHELTRRGIQAMLKPFEELCICCEAANGHEAIVKAKEHNPDLIISDIGMPVLNGVLAASRILKDTPTRKILMFTIAESQEILRAALAIGIKGLVFKTDPASDLIEAIDALRRGRTFFTRLIDDMILSGYLEDPRKKTTIKPNHLLTQRENEVIQLLAEGKSSKEIASFLGLSVKTAETHRSRIMRKLRVHSITGVTLYAVQHHIVEVPILPLPVQQRAAAGAMD